ncbi:MAG: ATP-binding protein [Arenicella sp.]
MQNQKPNFPFTAVTGQKSFKLALTLVAVNPVIGGVLVSGPRGSAKSTLAKGLADVMPDVDTKTANFVSLPLSVTEEMVVGTLNLQQVLNEKKVAFQEGLLAKANQGILYVDEVNLLQDHIVDLLLDVAASGVNVVERDGISHSHDAQFVLLGTMNPDEGELRPQLQDRFGLSVELGHEYGIAERIEIVQRREDFDADCQLFLQGYQQQQDALKNDILATRALLPNVKCGFELQELIAQKCHDAQVDGLRADIVWYRAAIAHAALHQRLVVTEEDIEAVEELVLSHRRKNKPRSPEPPRSPDSSLEQKPFSRPQSSVAGEGDNVPNQPEGDWGEMPPQKHQMADLKNVELPDIGNTQQEGMAKKHALNRSSAGSPIKAAIKQPNSVSQAMSHSSSQIANKGQNESNKVNWLSSLVASAGQWPLRQLRFYQTKKSQTILHLILIDTSASTLKNDLFSHAKAVILNIAEQAYVSREQLSIIGFGNQSIDTLLPRQRAPKALKEFLSNVPAAGGTPFREALEHAEKFQQQQYRQTPNMRIKTYIITDGKTRQSFSHVDLGSEVVLIDIEKSAVKRGKGQHIARDLNALYMPLFT